MTEKELAAELKGNFTKGFAGRYGKLIAENDLFGFALKLGLDRDPAVAFHASYALERAFFIAPEAFGRHIGLRSELPCDRQSERVPSLFEDDGVAARPEADRTDRQSASTGCRSDVRPADRPVGASGRKSVVDGDTRRLSAELPWVEEQLYDTICWLMRDDGPALRNRGRKSAAASVRDGRLRDGDCRLFPFFISLGHQLLRLWQRN